MTTETRVKYYHGSLEKLEPGDRLEPGKTMGKAAFGTLFDRVFVCREVEPEVIVQRKRAGEWVEAGTGLAAAAEYAAMSGDMAAEDLTIYEDFGGGNWHGFYVYEVEPMGELERDEQGEFEVDYQCDKARVIRTVIDNKGWLLPEVAVVIPGV